MHSGALRRASNSTWSFKRRTCSSYGTNFELPADLSHTGAPPPFTATCSLRLSNPMPQWSGVVSVPPCRHPARGFVACRSPVLIVFCVEVHESFRESFHRRKYGIFRESFHGSSFHENFCGSFHGSSRRCRGSHFHETFHESSTTASTEASMEVASMKAFPRNFTFYFHGSFRSFHGSSVASARASTEASTEVSTKLLRKLPRKHFHGILRFTSMEASAVSTEAQRLPRKPPRKLFVRAFKVASTKSRKLLLRKFTFYFHGSFYSFHGISAASTTAPTETHSHGGSNERFFK